MNILLILSVIYFKKKIKFILYSTLKLTTYVLYKIFLLRKIKIWFFINLKRIVVLYVGVYDDVIFFVTSMSNFLDYFIIIIWKQFFFLVVERRAELMREFFFSGEFSWIVLLQVVFNVNQRSLFHVIFVYFKSIFLWSFNWKYLSLILIKFWIRFFFYKCSRKSVDKKVFPLVKAKNIKW